jgi:archaemetzincin
MQSFLTDDSWRLLGVTAVDLYIPILTFVFGEAQMGGPCAVVSAHRLRQELYGLPADPKLFRQRVIKEAVHELGHTVSLTHCDDYRCAMAPSHAVEWIDLKESTLCTACQSVATPATKVSSGHFF